MIPDERTCQYFMTIAREKNISRAARCLYISQPSLSRFLTGLEKELGTPLFIRNNGILSLTRAAVFSVHCRLKGNGIPFFKRSFIPSASPETDSEDRGRFHHQPLSG